MSEPINAVIVREQNPVAQALSVTDILAQVKLIQEVMRQVMTEGEHFGTIPGCGDKKTLLQPGAQKLTMTFRLGPEYQIQEVDLPRGHKEYRVICTLKSIQSGVFVGQGVGCCSSMESKYRWRQGARKCPKCGKETIIMGKKFKPTDPEPGWLCWAKKGGCGATWPKGAQEIEGQSIDKVENENPADCFNTVLKIAKKRAFVDATITATAASDIFTQDIGDDEGEPAEAPPTSRPASQPPSTQARQSKAPITPNGGAKQANVEPKPQNPALAGALKVQIDKLAQALGKKADYAVAYLRCWTADGSDAGAALMPNEGLDALSEHSVQLLREDWKGFLARLDSYIEDQGGLGPAVDPDVTQVVPRSAVDAAIKQAELSANDPNSPDAPWRSFPVPFGKMAGKKLADIEKKYLFGFWANFAVETEYQGKPKKPETIAKDTAFREMLDEAGKHYGFTKQD